MDCRSRRQRRGPGPGELSRVGHARHGRDQRHCLRHHAPRSDRPADRGAEATMMMTPPPFARPKGALNVLAALLESRTGQQIAANREWRIETALKPLIRENGLE